MYGLGDPLDSLLIKVERAKKHVLDLESERDAFFQTKPYSFAHSTNPITGDRTYYLKTVESIPKVFSVILGDALNNLRCALDHLVHHLACVGAGATKACAETKFPIGNSDSHYNSQKRSALKGLRPDGIKAIDALEPYIGGSGEALVRLARLNNFDKHRLLLTAWSCFDGHKALPRDRAMLAKFHGGEPSQYANSFVAPPTRVFPLEAGDTLLVIPKEEVEEGMTFLLGIAFAEPEIARGIPVIETLHDMVLRVRHIIFEFDKKHLL
jgi:hypothetical protein